MPVGWEHAGFMLQAGKSDSEKSDVPGNNFHWKYDAALGLLCLLIVGLVAWAAQPGFIELRYPQPKDAYYNLEVEGFRAGQLNLSREAPPELARHANPYDPAVNTAFEESTIDMSYYKGKLYLYYGVVPAIVLYWPYV